VGLGDRRADGCAVLPLDKCRGSAHDAVLALLAPAGKLSVGLLLHVPQNLPRHALAPFLRACRALDSRGAIAAEHQGNLVALVHTHDKLGAPARTERQNRHGRTAFAHALQLRAPRRNYTPRPRLPRQRWLGWGPRQQSCHGPSLGHSFDRRFITSGKMAGLSAPLPQGGGGKGVKRRWFSTAGAHCAATRNHVRSVLSYPSPRGPSRRKFVAITRDNTRLCWTNG
jgi:hypothetical protein